MARLDSIIRKLAHPRDRTLLDESPSRRVRLRVLARIGLRFWWAYLAVLAVVSLGTVATGLDLYHQTEHPQFCGACHEMSPNLSSWSESQHKNITCADCHSRTGALGWMQAKVAGVKQLKVHFTSTEITGIEIDPSQRGILNENCSRCHAGVARVGERFGLGVSHRQHLDSGIDCITCHSGTFAHPRRGAEEGEEAEGEQDGGEESEPPAPTATTDVKVRFVDVVECYKCHDGGAGAGTGDATGPRVTTAGLNAEGGVLPFSATDEAHCLKCHPDADHALAHGARHPSSAERRPCLDCHERGEGELHFTLEEKAGPLCARCHEQEAHASRHAPYKRGDCQECHRVMSPTYLFKDGPRPTNGVCLGCHESVATVLAQEEPTELSNFAEGGIDLHKLHGKELGKELEGAGGDWCLACHGPHGSDSELAVLRVKQQPDFKRPARVVVQESFLARCEGGCHAAKGVSYSGE